MISTEQTQTTTPAKHIRDAAKLPESVLHQPAQYDQEDTVSTTAPSSEMRCRGPSFKDLTETLLEFPALDVSLAQVFSEASQQDGGLYIADLADKPRRIAATGEVYSPMEISRTPLETIICYFGLLYDDDPY